MPTALEHPTLTFGTAVLMAVALGLPLPARANGKRTFEVSDSVEMSYFGTLATSVPDDLDDDGVLSPDGRYFVKVTDRGLLPQGVSESTVWIFDAAAVRKSVNDSRVPVPKPSALVRMSVTANSGTELPVLDDGNAITDPRWSADGRTLTFLGRNGHPNRQLFRIDIDTRRLTALTPPTQDVLDYAGSGTRFVYLVGPDADKQAEQAWVSAGPGIPDIAVGTSTSLMPLLYPHFRGNAYSEPLEVQLWQVKDNHAKPTVDSRSGTPVKLLTRYNNLLVSMSPDYTHAVTIAEAAARPVAGGFANGENSARLEYLLIDLRSGLDRPVSEDPIDPGINGRYRAAWSSDGTRLAITGVLRPGEAGASHAQACGIAVVTLGAPDEQCVALPADKRALSSVEWLAGMYAIHARYFVRPRYVDEVWRQQGTGWTEDPDLANKVQPNLELEIQEGLNDPPVLAVTDRSSGNSRAVFDPNPQLANVALGTASVYHWKDSHGRENLGGLVLPADYTPGKRYGLVLQTHGFYPKRGGFFRVGPSDTSSAGRALAGRDLIVLQVREPYPDRGVNWHDSIEFGMDIYLAAIDKLAADGLVDPTRVGISGYSYSGWLVATSITRAPDRFAAAELANCDPVTLTGYDEHVRAHEATGGADPFVGARPYGDGLKIWFERSPAFATDKITAPVLFQPTDPQHLLSLYDMYAALLDQGKPVELQYIRGGEHNIRKPLEVFAHQEMIVDWFDFWLNGHEDASPRKLEQYQRWRKLREARAAARAEASSSQPQGH
jgi:dipeptidyl aminopeptidase/acylaminoacyl peptidase